LNHLEFCEFLGPAAYELERTRGYPMEAVMTQVHLESGGLASYPAGSNNVLGIKFRGGEYVEALTWEQNVDGSWVQVTARWQKFNSLLSCLDGWADLMDESWYAQAQPYKQDWAAFLALIWHNGTKTVYASDHLYLWKAVKRAADVGIPQWCANYRAKMAPAVEVAAPTILVTVIIDGVETACNATNIGGWAHANLEPFLLLLQRYGVDTSYDWQTRTLTLTTPTTP
jgi:hypothetical protein